MPPIQWEKLRQNSIQWLSASTSGRIDAPVVVKPETISNTASRYEGIVPESVNGTAPTSDSTIQHSATVTKPSLA